MKLLRLLKAGLQKVFGITSTPKENALAKALERECAKLEQRERQQKKPSVVAKAARLKKGAPKAKVSGVQQGNRRKRVRLADKGGGGVSGNKAKRNSSSSGKGTK